jgi:hypothetical protein
MRSDFNKNIHVYIDFWNPKKKSITVKSIKFRRRNCYSGLDFKIKYLLIWYKINKTPKT